MSARVLKGYQNTTEGLSEVGLTISWDGTHFNILDIDPESEALKIERLATSLARDARYVGHTAKKYTVAQHVCRGAEALILFGMVEEAKEFLFHDGSEGITKDFSAPLKRLLGDKMSQIESGIEIVLAKKYGYNYPYSPVVHQLDKNLAQDEMSMLMKSEKREEFDYWDEDKARTQFIYMYYKIEEMLKYNSKEIIKK